MNQTLIHEIKLKEEIIEISENNKEKFDKILKVQANKDISYFEKFKDFPYDDWKPVRQRIEFVNANAKGKRLLDLGCGFYPVTVEAKVDFKVGLDVSIKAAKKAIKDFEEFHLIDLANISKEDLKDNLGSFDTIVASEFLEHLENPGELVEKITELLEENGIALITVPNGRSIAGIVDKLRNGGKYNRFKLFHRTHVSLLKNEEWIKLFRENGLRVKKLIVRPSDIVEGFPKENNFLWKNLAKVFPNILAHQFFYVLERRENERAN